MSDYETTLKEYVTNGQLTQPEADDLLAQKAAFDANRKTIEATLKGKCVGYVSGHMLVAQTHTALLAQVKKEHPGKLTYFETVGSSLIEEF
jgi:hypothetical protein